jgi:hypothetical protein
MSDPGGLEPKAKSTARSMIKRYGRARAHEHAWGYAVGAYFRQTENGRQHWLAVCEWIRKLPKGEDDATTWGS